MSYEILAAALYLAIGVSVGEYLGIRPKLSLRIGFALLWWVVLLIILIERSWTDTDEV